MRPARSEPVRLSRSAPTVAELEEALGDPYLWDHAGLAEARRRVEVLLRRSGRPPLAEMRREAVDRHRMPPPGFP